MKAHLLSKVAIFLLVWVTTSTAFADDNIETEAVHHASEREALPDPSRDPHAELSEPEQATPATRAHAEHHPTGDDEIEKRTQARNDLAFADHLFLDGDYYRAITEYRRFLFAVRGQDENAPRAAMAIGEALMRGEKWDAAGRQYDGIATRTQRLDLRQQALFAAGRAYLLDARPEMAKPRFRLLVESDDTPSELARDASWLLAWGHFDAGEFEEAYELFRRMAQSDGANAKDAQGVADALLEKNQLDQKDPVLAGLLSIVPGLGHFYLGRWGVGLTSLTWNGIFLYAMTHAFLTQQWGLALVLAVFELGWYTGGIFGAVAGAMRHNRDAVRNWRDDILLQYGKSRELPDAHLFHQRTPPAPPGTWLRVGTSF